MIRFALRRNRIQLPIWILAIASSWVVSASAIANQFGATEAARRRLLSVVAANPTVLALRGPADGPTQAGLVWFQVAGFVGVLAALMSTFLATRGLRGDEERGRLETVRSTPIGRLAPLTAVIVVGGGANVVAGALGAVVLAALGFDPGGAALAGAAVAAVGLAFLGIGALASQIMPTGRAANTAGVAIVTLAYVLRAVGDALGSVDPASLVETSAWPSWVSPIGWMQQVSPFRAANPVPVLLLVGLAIVTTVSAALVQSRRDLEEALLPEREGRASARPYLGSPLGLLVRQNRTALLWWVVTGAFFGAIAGSLSGAVQDAVARTDGVGSVLVSLAGGGSGSIVDTFVVAIASIGGVTAVAAGLQTLLRMRGEESDGRAELLLSAPATRVGWLLGSLLLAALSAALVTVTAGAVAGLSFLASGAPSDRLGSSILSGVAQLPMIACFLGIAALAIAVLPRAATTISWGALAVGYALGPLGGILQLKQWMIDLSPLEHTPQIPGPHPDWGPAMIVLAVGVALAALATLAMTRRQVTT